MEPYTGALTAHTHYLTMATERTRQIEVVVSEHYDTEIPCRANLAHNTVYVRPIRTSTDYAVALHEIGHLRDPQARRIDNLLQAECLAWIWAIDHAVVWTPETQTHMRVCLGEYTLSYPQYVSRTGMNPEKTIAHGERRLTIDGWQK